MGGLVGVRGLAAGLLRSRLRGPGRAVSLRRAGGMSGTHGLIVSLLLIVALFAWFA